MILQEKIDKCLSNIIDGIYKLDTVYEGHLVFREDVIKLIEKYKTDEDSG